MLMRRSWTGKQIQSLPPQVDEAWQQQPGAWSADERFWYVGTEAFWAVGDWEACANCQELTQRGAWCQVRPGCGTKLG